MPPISGVGSPQGGEPVKKGEETAPEITATSGGRTWSIPTTLSALLTLISNIFKSIFGGSEAQQEPPKTELPPPPSPFTTPAPPPLTSTPEERLEGKGPTADALLERQEKIGALGEKMAQVTDLTREFGETAKQGGVASMHRGRIGGLFTGIQKGFSRATDSLTPQELKAIAAETQETKVTLTKEDRKKTDRVDARTDYISADDKDRRAVIYLEALREELSDMEIAPDLRTKGKGGGTYDLTNVDQLKKWATGGKKAWPGMIREIVDHVRVAKYYLQKAKENGVNPDRIREHEAYLAKVSHALHQAVTT